MGNRTAKFISALVGSIVAGAPLAAVSQNAPVATSTASTAADCLASPKGAAPQGQHWFYRLDRATKRQCWYLRAEGAKDSAKPVQTAQAAPDTPPVASAVPQPHSVQDARAEYLTPQSTATAKTTPAQQAANPAADTSAQQPVVADRWPDASTTTSPAAQPAPAPVAAAAPPNAKPSKSPTPVALATADSSTDRPTGSLQPLLLVVGGALALAGLLASIVYRFAGGRARAQAADHRRVNWDHAEPHDLDDRAPWLHETPDNGHRALLQPGPVDFDAARSQTARSQAAHIAAFTTEIGRIAAQARATPPDVVELDEADIFDEEFEIEASAPRLAANDLDDDVPVEDNPVDRDERVKRDDHVDVDVITAMLERLAQEGPRLSQPSPEADLADFARSPRGQSAARA